MPRRRVRWKEGWRAVIDGRRIAVIKKIHVQNFKCLRDVEVELGPFNVLIGPNDSGKTTLLQAIELLRGLSNLQIPFSETMIWHRRKDLKTRLTVNSTSDGSKSISLELPLTQEFMQTLVQRIHGRDPSLQHLTSSATYRLNPSSMRADAHSENDPVLKSDGSNLAAVLHAMLSGPDRQAILELEKKLCEAIPTLKGISTPISAGPGRHCIDFTLNVSSKPPITIPSMQASDGAMLLLAFLVLVYGNAPDILLIEEPENGLHPSRLKMVIEILRKISTGELGNKARQVILTTHSPLLLNFVKPEEVRIFNRDESGATQITPMNKVPNIDRLQKDYAPGELLYLFGEEDLVKGQAT
jgi:predicted ATPase